MMDMVARFADIPAPWAADTPVETAPNSVLHRSQSLTSAEWGQRLLARASSLEGVRLGGRGISSFAGVPLRYCRTDRRRGASGFVKGRIFAVVADDGAMCLRLSDEIASDLIDNGLCVGAGKLSVTWPIASSHQLEIFWRVLLHAYWDIAGTPPRHTRRMWSEWIINH